MTDTRTTTRAIFRETAAEFGEFIADALASEPGPWLVITAPGEHEVCTTRRDVAKALHINGDDCPVHLIGPSIADQFWPELTVVEREARQAAAEDDDQDKFERSLRYR